MKLENTVVWERLQRQGALGRKRSALITDIDNTLYRARHEDAVKAAWEIRRRATDSPFPIIAVTGGDYDALVKGRLESGEIPLLDVVVGSVGTEMWFLLADGTYQKDLEYHKRLQATGYDRPTVLEKVVKLLPKLRKQGFNVEFQDPEAEATYRKKPDPRYLPFKISLYFLADVAESTKVAAVFAEEFKSLKIVVCEEIHYNAKLAPGEKHKKYCLDILAATKADAANYLIEKLDIEQGVVAGDSGNDIDLLLDTPDAFMAVVVGGYKPELQQALAQKLTAKTTDGYGAVGKKRIFIEPSERVAAQTLLLFSDFLSGKA